MFLDACYLKTITYGGSNGSLGVGSLMKNLAGSTTCNTIGADGVGTSAKFGQLYAAVLIPDSTTLVVSDVYNKIKKVDYISRSVTTLLYQKIVSGVPQNSDGTGTSASIAYPYALTYSKNSGALYVGTDASIRKVTYPGTVVSTLSISGYVSSNKNFQSLSSDGTFMIMTDQYTGVVQKYVFSSNALSVIGGNSAYDCLDGVGTNARFAKPTYSVIDASNSVVYIADSYYNLRIRRMDLSTLQVSCLIGSCPVLWTQETHYIQGMVLSPDQTFLIFIDYINTNGVKQYILKRVDVLTGTVDVINPSSGSAYDFALVNSITLIPGAKGPCVMCEEGKFSLSGSLCKICPAGYFCVSGISLPCPSGRWRIISKGWDLFFFVGVYGFISHLLLLVAAHPPPREQFSHSSSSSAGVDLSPCH